MFYREHSLGSIRILGEKSVRFIVYYINNCEWEDPTFQQLSSDLLSLDRVYMISGLSPDEDAVLNEIIDDINFELSSKSFEQIVTRLNMTNERVANAFISLHNKGLISIPDLGAIISCCACGTTWAQSKSHPDVEVCPYCNEIDSMMTRYL